MVTLVACYAVIYAVQNDAPFLSAVIVLVILIIGFRLAFSILPAWVGKFVGDVVGFLTRVVLGTGIKGKK